MHVNHQGWSFTWRGVLSLSTSFALDGKGWRQGILRRSIPLRRRKSWWNYFVAKAFFTGMKIFPRMRRTWDDETTTNYLYNISVSTTNQSMKLEIMEDHVWKFQPRPQTYQVLNHWIPTPYQSSLKSLKIMFEISTPKFIYISSFHPARRKSTTTAERQKRWSMKMWLLPPWPFMPRPIPMPRHGHLSQVKEVLCRAGHCQTSTSPPRKARSSFGRLWGRILCRSLKEENQKTLQILWNQKQQRRNLDSFLRFTLLVVKYPSCELLSQVGMKNVFFLLSWNHDHPREFLIQ